MLDQEFLDMLRENAEAASTADCLLTLAPVGVLDLLVERNTFLEAVNKLQDELDRRLDDEHDIAERVMDKRRDNCACPVCGDEEYHQDGCELGEADAEIERLQTENSQLKASLSQQDEAVDQLRLLFLQDTVTPQVRLFEAQAEIDRLNRVLAVALTVIDRRAFMALSIEDRRLIMQEQAERAMDAANREELCQG